MHRDVKPQNILRDQQGKVYLVDFGAVQDKYRQTLTGGSTFVGTFGFMAPEQFRGNASLATDLYGLGTTLLYLLTGQDPLTFQNSDTLKLRIPENLKLTLPFRQWLESLLEPSIESRPPTAEIALEILEGKSTLILPEQNITYRPKKTNIQLVKTEQYLFAKFMPYNWRDPWNLGHLLALILSFFYLGFILLSINLLGGDFFTRNIWFINGVLFLLFLLAVFLVFHAWKSLFTPTTVVMTIVRTEIREL